MFTVYCPSWAFHVKSNWTNSFCFLGNCYYETTDMQYRNFKNCSLHLLCRICIWQRFLVLFYSIAYGIIKENRLVSLVKKKHSPFSETESLKHTPYQAISQSNVRCFFFLWVFLWGYVVEWSWYFSQTVWSWCCDLHFHHLQKIGCAE